MQLRDVALENYRKLWDTYGLNAPTFSKLVGELVGFIFVKYSANTSDETWNRLYTHHETPKHPKIEIWQELIGITNAVEELLIQKNTQKINKNTAENDNNIDLFINNKISTKTVRYGVFNCQETVLPLFFKYAHQRKLNVEFVEMQNWGHSIDAFDSQDINIMLHDFSSAIAATLHHGRPFLFFPFFYFNGYGIFVKKTSIEKFCRANRMAIKKFSLLSNEQKKLFLEQHKIILNKGTDFEWIYKSYCEKYHCDLNSIDANIDNQDVNDGRELFTSTDYTSDMYCTNSIHIIDMRDDESIAQKYELISGEDLTEHKNYNGLICDSLYYEENPAIVQELIKVWFNSIEFFMSDLKKLGRWRKEGKEVDDFLNYLPAFLNKKTKANIKFDQLKEMYETYNGEFKANLQTTLADFYKDINSPNSLNYINIVSMLAGKDVEDVGVALTDIKTYMTLQLNYESK